MNFSTLAYGGGSDKQPACSALGIAKSPMKGLSIALPSEVLLRPGSSVSYTEHTVVAIETFD